jgi:hypothetical protein
VRRTAAWLRAYTRAIDSRLLNLVPGLTFKDNGNGTATIGGTPPFPVDNAFCLSGGPCGITAASSQGTVVQQFTINIVSAPPAFPGPPPSATFVAGIFNQVVLTSFGAITPVSWNISAAPSCLNLTDNGDATAKLSGTPPLDAAGTFTPFVGPAS